MESLSSSSHQNQTKIKHQAATSTVSSASRRLPKSERRVRFADTMGMELVSIFLFDLLNNYVNFYNNSIEQHSANQSRHQSQYTKNTNSNNNINTYNNLTNTTLNNQHLPANSSNSSTKSVSCNTFNSPTSFTGSTSSAGTTSSNNSKPIFKCEFPQPISLISFRERVKMNKVQLETCNIKPDPQNTNLTQSRATANSTSPTTTTPIANNPDSYTINCIIRVLNLSYDKSVTVRYTIDEWHTFREYSADYKTGSNDGWSDRFSASFTIDCKSLRRSFSQANNSIMASQRRIMFAVRYSVNDARDVFWDNNGGKNYVISIADDF